MSEPSVELKDKIKEAQSRRRKTKPVDPADTIFCGNRLREIRKDYGLNQQDLADLIGVTRTQIVNLERGNCNTSVSNLYKIAYHFGVSTEITRSGQTHLHRHFSS
jgi:DNA-binding XRE family transcriptional regulator